MTHICHYELDPSMLQNMFYVIAENTKKLSINKGKMMIRRQLSSTRSLRPGATTQVASSCMIRLTTTPTNEIFTRSQSVPVIYTH